MFKAKAYSAASARSPLASTTIPRRDPTEHDVQIEILFCGICHSDLHSVRNEWSEYMPTVYPIVPGHEIVGRVIKVGSAVTKFKPGDLAAVGCLVDSDGTCAECWAGLEQFCPNLVLTFNSPDKHLGGVTYGGYFEHRRRPEVRPARPLKPEPRWSRTSPLCWNHDLLADAPLGRHQGQESWRGRTRGPRPHGCEVCTRAGGSCGRLYNFAKQKRGR